MQADGFRMAFTVTWSNHHQKCLGRTLNGCACKSTTEYIRTRGVLWELKKVQSARI